MATTEKWAKLFKSRHQYADSVPVQFGNAKDAAFNWDGTNLQLLPVTDDTGAFNIGDGTTDMDVKIFGATTGNYLHWDESADDLLLVGIATQLAVAGTTASSSTTTGSLRTAGGLGVAGAAYIGGLLNVTIASLNATTGRIATLMGTVLTPNFGDGYGAIECQLNIGTGAIAGHVAAMSSWINLDAGSTMGSLGNCISPLDVGIYAPSGTFTNGKFIMGLKMSCVIDNGANPGELYLFNTNIFSNATTALFDVNTIVDLSATATAAATGAYKLPFLKERSTGTVWYMNIYTS